MDARFEVGYPDVALFAAVVVAAWHFGRWLGGEIYRRFVRDEDGA